MSSNETSKDSGSEPSMIGGHVKYVQGALSSLIGNESGETTKQDAVQEMKDANAASSGQPAQSGVLGTVEKAVGGAVGCEGMEKDGAERIPDRRGVEEQSGTG